MLAAKDASNDDAFSRCDLLDAQGHFRALDDIERIVLVEALSRYRGNASQISQYLQIGRTRLYRRLAYHGLDPNLYRRGVRSTASPPRS